MAILHKLKEILNIIMPFNFMALDLQYDIKYLTIIKNCQFQVVLLAIIILIYDYEVIYLHWLINEVICFHLSGKYIIICQ